jgi:hypothetical protein
MAMDAMDAMGSLQGMVISWQNLEITEKSWIFITDKWI